MNILYKYCDRLGIVKILELLELKLPYISHVNDPLECLPFFYCPDDKAAMEAQWLRTFKRSKVTPPTDWKHKLHEQFETGEIQKKLTEDQRQLLELNQRKTCLLSVSATAQNTVMWAHYADKHKGAVIGIDFNKIFTPYGIKMRRVDYSEQRPKINVLDDSETEYSCQKYLKTLLTKSTEWTYEREFRSVFRDTYLTDLEQQGLACLKDFNGQKTWFLRLSPESIREVILGLYTDDALKLAIGNLIQGAELQHVKLYQTKESETYALNLAEIER